MKTLLIGFGINFSHPAMAEPEKVGTSNVAGWDVSAYIDDSSFSHCTASTTYEARTEAQRKTSKQAKYTHIGFKVFYDSNWSFYIMSPDWNFDTERTYSMTINFMDGSKWGPFEGRPVDEHGIEVVFGAPASFVYQLSALYGMTIQINGKDAGKFKLTGSAKMTEALLDCAKVGIGMSVSGKGTFDGGTFD